MTDDALDLPDDIWFRLLKGYDDPWEVEAPADFDFVEAKERFLALAQAVEQAVAAAVGGECDLEVWPLVRGATFHGLLQLPPSATGGEGAASLRASNFGNLVTLYPTDEAVTPEVRSRVRALAERHGYRYVPSRVLRKAYAGHHAGKAPFDRWGERFFGYT